MKKIAINGFGRIGRLFLRQFLESKSKKAQIIAINDLGDVDNLAYLLRYDTVYRQYPGTVEVKNGNLVVDGKLIKFLQIKDPTQLPWKDLGIDVVVESTGVFNTFEKSKAHLDAGAKRVLLTAPAKDEDSKLGKTVLVGANDKEANVCPINSNGSCTTNAGSPVIAIMNETIGVKKALLNTVHGYTATQSLVDGPTRSSDYRKGRAAAQNIVPTTTGAAIAITRALPDLRGKFDGVSFRAAVVTGSAANITFLAKRNTTAEEINDIFRKAAKEKRWKGVLAITENPLVSSDIIGNPHGAIVDLKFTKVIDGDLVNVLSWYDNEYGYVSTLLKHLELIL
ncbi:MAG: aldehyde dehydrogenase [Candidatus Colwellbacteria bacterium]|nr:aldehyde dehydrogenase [Candidatus Colwellbacteria bacterium]